VEDKGDHMAKDAKKTAPAEPVLQAPEGSGETIDLKELLEAGAHFGHQVRRWNPKMIKYIFTTRDNVHIIDLAKTAKCLEEAMAFVTKWVGEGNEIVFVGTKRQAQAIVKEEALKAGAPYVTERWLGGMLSNWDEMQKRIGRLKDLKQKRDSGAFNHYTKKERVLLDREISRLERFFGGIANLPTRPQALFVVDTHKEMVAVKEASAVGIPIVGMVDTNGDPDLVNYVIPINDDAVRTIKLTVTKIAEAYQRGIALRKKTNDEPKNQGTEKLKNTKEPRNL
jgi:small subunit ribosomal protein S2